MDGVSLTDLHAKYDHGELWLDCPCRAGHRICIVTDEFKAKTRAAKHGVVGTFPELTIHPAILSACASFSIIKGKIESLVT